MPPSSDARDIFSNVLAFPIGPPPQRSDSGIKLDLASIFHLPDDLLHTPSTSEEDLISVVLRDIQRNSFNNFTNDDFFIDDFASSTFNIGSDEFDAMILGKQGVKKDQSRIHKYPIAMPQPMETGSALLDPTSVVEKGDDLHDRRPSPEVIHAIDDTIVHNPQILSPSPTESSPSPIQEYLLPIRGRPRRSKTDEQQQSSTVASSMAPGANGLQSSTSASAHTIPSSDKPDEKAVKTRRKARKIVKPNPYPQRRSDACTSTCQWQDRPTSSSNISSLPSSTVVDFPLSISDDKSRSFILTPAKWNQPVFANVSSGFEHDDRSLHYHLPAVATWPTAHPNDHTLSSGMKGKRKRKLADDYGEEDEAGGGATRRIGAPYASKLALNDIDISVIDRTLAGHGCTDSFTGLMEDYSYSLQLDSYRHVFASR